MASLNQIVVTIVANGQQYTATLKGIAQQTQQTASAIQTSMNGASAAHNAAGQSVSNFASRLKNAAGEALGNIARFTSYYLSVKALTTIIGGAISELRQFDANMHNVQSITLESDASLKAHSKSLLEMVISGQSAGKSASDLSAAMYEIVSAGYDSNQALALVKVAALGAAAGLTDTHSASVALLSILQAYHLPVSEAMHVMDQLFTIVDLGVIHFDQLVSGIGMVIPLAAQLKVPINELGAAIELLTRQGQQPTRVMTNLADVLKTFLKPNAAFTEQIARMGFESGEAMIRTLGFAGSIQKLGQEAGGSDAKLAAWFGDIRAIRAVLPLAANGGRDFIEMLKKHNAEIDLGGRTQKAWNEQQKSFNAQAEIFTSKLKALAMVGLAPVVAGLASVLKTINDLISGLVVFDSATGKSIFWWEAHSKIISAVKAVLLGLITVIVGSLIPAFASIITAFGGIGVIFSRFMVLNPFVALVAGIIAVLSYTGLLGSALHLVMDGLNLVSDHADIVKAVFISFSIIKLAPVLFEYARFLTYILSLQGVSGVINGIKTAMTGLGLSLPTLGWIAVLVGFFIAMEKFSHMGPVADGLNAMKTAVDAVHQSMIRLQKDTAEGSLARSLGTQKILFDGLSKIVDDTVVSYKHLDEANKSGLPTWNRLSTNLSTVGGMLTHLDFRSAGTRLKEGITKELQEVLKAADGDVAALARLSDQLRAAAANADPAHAAAFKEADRQVQLEIGHIIDQNSALVDVRVKAGETTTAFVTTNDILEKITKKVDTWAANLKPILGYMQTLTGYLTAGEAVDKAKIADLDLQLAKQKPLADAEKLASDASLKGLEARKKLLQDALDSGGKSTLQSQTQADRMKQQIDALRAKTSLTATEKSTLATLIIQHQQLLDKIKLEKDAQTGGKQGIENQIKLVDAQIQKAKDLLGPEQTRQKVLQDQRDIAAGELDIKKKTTEALAANSIAERALKLEAAGVSAKQSEINFLAEAANAIIDGNTEKVAALAAKWEIPPARVQELINKAILLDKEDFTPKLDQKPLETANKNAESLKGNMDAIGNRTTDIIVRHGQLDNALQKAKDLLSTLGSIAKKAVGSLGSALGFAGGVSDWVGGMAMVGENGPEMALLPRGTSIASSPKTSQILEKLENSGGGSGGGSSGGGGGGNVNVNFLAPTKIEATTKAGAERAAKDFGYGVWSDLRSRGIL